MTKNNDVVNSFICGFENPKTKHLFIEKLKNGISVLYSYGYHFPLCIKLLDDTFLINSYGYSHTTARHKSLVCYALKMCNFKEIVKTKHNDIMFFNTEQLKKILDNNFKNKLEIIQNKI